MSNKSRAEGSILDYGDDFCPCRLEFDEFELDLDAQTDETEIKVQCAKVETEKIAFAEIMNQDFSELEAGEENLDNEINHEKPDHCLKISMDNQTYSGLEDLKSPEFSKNAEKAGSGSIGAKVEEIIDKKSRFQKRPVETSKNPLSKLRQRNVENLCAAALSEAHALGAGILTTNAHLKACGLGVMAADLIDFEAISRSGRSNPGFSEMGELELPLLPDRMFTPDYDEYLDHCVLPFDTSPWNTTDHPSLEETQLIMQELDRHRTAVNLRRHRKGQEMQQGLNSNPVFVSGPNLTPRLSLTGLHAKVMDRSNSRQEQIYANQEVLNADRINRRVVELLVGKSDETEKKKIIYKENEPVTYDSWTDLEITWTCLMEANVSASHVTTPLPAFSTKTEEVPKSDLQNQVGLEEKPPLYPRIGPEQFRAWKKMLTEIPHLDPPTPPTSFHDPYGISEASDNYLDLENQYEFIANFSSNGGSEAIRPPPVPSRALKPGRFSVGHILTQEFDSPTSPVWIPMNLKAELLNVSEDTYWLMLHSDPERMPPCPCRCDVAPNFRQHCPQFYRAHCRGEAHDLCWLRMAKAGKVVHQGLYPST